MPEEPTFAATMRLLPFTTPSDSGSAEPVEPASIAVIIIIRIIEKNVERTKGKGDLEPTELVHLPHPRGVASKPPIHTRNRDRWKPVRSSRTWPWSWASVVFLSLPDPCIESSFVTVLCQLARPGMGESDGGEKLRTVLVMGGLKGHQATIWAWLAPCAIVVRR